MLYWIDNDTEATIPHSRSDFYKKGLARLDDNEKENLFIFINDMIQDTINNSSGDTQFISPDLKLGVAGQALH